MRIHPRWGSPTSLPRSLVGLVAVAALSTALAGCDDDFGVVSGEGTLTSRGGKVHVQCIDHTQVKIVSADPAGGYTVRMLVQGPAAQASLIFENPKANDFRVAVNCDNYEPAMQEFEIEDTTINKG
jgi:hypothetical protein